MQTYAGISVVNALPGWYGSSMAIDLKVEVKVSETEYCESQDILIDTIIQFFRQKYNLPCMKAEINSEIPPKGGLKSSSAVSTALIAEIMRRYKIKDVDPPKLSAILSLKAGVSYTGAYDDATSSYYGGVTFTFNKEFQLIEIKEPPDISVVLLPRGNRQVKIDLNHLKRYAGLFQEIFNVARKDIITGMRLNGIAMAEILGYDTSPIKQALKGGALASGISGNGPSIFAVTKPGDEGKVIDIFSNFGEVLVTRVVEPRSLE
ncbi:shikimate kinase [Sulfolobus acidocaldarius]|nr:shikimate kinase [Sulfolobus acidocaldarius]AGE70160.1 shikimate kinase [Sulfolobus acidocaldarius N8]AGE72435.1 shikimate kinase [Sulfolobus acidocaldarius Ron12/I]ALU29429.1 shikimate kinase [Sulfolobus acidocaldarius]ALU32157.1 shikimate kinase [Sulfolobus acidocaldarius]WCM34180.1 shikimate kinase [Sulfolobus acidocaldarius DSM 639]